MRILVTGGRGFLGGHVYEALRDAGHGVVALGRADGDLAEPGVAERLVARHAPDAVVHLAAVMPGDERLAQNAPITALVAAACHARGIPLYHGSSTSVLCRRHAVRGQQARERGGCGRGDHAALPLPVRAGAAARRDPDDAAAGARRRAGGRLPGLGALVLLRRRRGRGRRALVERGERWRVGRRPRRRPAAARRGGAARLCRRGGRRAADRDRGSTRPPGPEPAARHRRLPRPAAGRVELEEGLARRSSCARTEEVRVRGRSAALASGAA